MIQLPYNISKPENGDKGAEFFPALEALIDAFVAHTHDDTNSAAISISDLTRPKVTLAKNDWVGIAGGYTQAVTLPAGLSLENVAMRFRVTSGPEIHTPIYPQINPLSVTSFEIIVNEQLDLEVLFI